MARAKTTQVKPRDYQHENLWQKAAYKRFEIKMEREQGEVFRKFLQDKKMSFADWVREAYDLQLQEKREKGIDRE